ncbi:mobilization protein mobC [Dickeya dianthicola]|nr:mobilization protein mobC [Dickeya dianthicola]MBI0451414.1 mobilization protein mobC [Dickeya dianthicola]MBI0455835.1 mobilization protein mobC [Dickeya dianthicola]MBI0460132.1 mobilization protein mobC [Dickeya dianthicola]MBI0464258.1 mobilization protein mobC [Dickeya dianthicola]
MSVTGTERTESNITKHLEQRRLMLQWWANLLDANSNGLVRLFDSIRTVARNGIPVPFDARCFCSAR